MHAAQLLSQLVTHAAVKALLMYTTIRLHQLNNLFTLSLR